MPVVTSDKHNFCTFEQKPGFGGNIGNNVNSVNSGIRAQSETRKKYSFEDEEANTPYSKKEYFLKGIKSARSALIYTKFITLAKTGVSG